MAKNRGVAKAGKKLQKDADEHLDIACAGGALVLWDMGWRKTRICRVFNYMHQVWNECAAEGTGKSMLQMVEEETGIELRTPDGQSWHNYSYLNSEVWDGRLPKSPAEQVLIWTRMLKWNELQMRAALYLALHRKENWGFERLAAFSQRFDELKRKLGKKPITYRRTLEKDTGITMETLYHARASDI